MLAVKVKHIAIFKGLPFTRNLSDHFLKSQVIIHLSYGFRVSEALN